MRSMTEILKLVCEFLNEEKVVYVVVGGLAVLFYGIPRTIDEMRRNDSHNF
jgi:hypothetical protein